MGEMGDTKGSATQSRERKKTRTEPGPLVQKERLHRPTKRKKTQRRPGTEEVGQELAGRLEAVEGVRAFRLQWALKREERARTGEADSERKQHYSPVKVFCAPGGLTRTEREENEENQEDWEEKKRKKESQEAAEAAQDRRPA